MNRIALLTLALAAAGVSTFAFAQARDHGDHAGHRGMRGGIVALDKDQDGRIARAELPAQGHGAMLAAQFDAIDANRDGYLVRTELQAWGMQHRAERQAQRAQRQAQRFAEADLNKDGKLSKLEVGEKMPRMAQRFAWMDDNRDGFLSREELRPMRGHRGR